MKNFIKENWFKIAIMLALFFFIFFYKNQSGYIDNPFKNSYTSNNTLSSDIIICRFDIVSDFIKSGDDTTSRIKYQTAKQKDPIPLTFSNLSGENPVMKGNGGESPLTVLRNDDDILLLAEQSLLGDMFLYTIFKKQKVATWQKSYDLIGSPYALISMGYCN